MTYLTSNYTSTWSVIISIGMLLLSLKFPILFLINGIFGLAFGIYFVIAANAEKEKMDEIDKTGTLGAFLLGYHIYKALSMPKYAWANYIHIFLVAPLLVLIGFYGKETSYVFFQYCLMLAFASFGYHAYSIFKEMNV